MGVGEVPGWAGLLAVRISVELQEVRGSLDAKRKHLKWG